MDENGEQIVKSYKGIKYDSSKILNQIDWVEKQKPKIDEMYRLKNQLFDYIHHRIKSYGKSHNSQKFGWYKKHKWGDRLNQNYYDKNTKQIKGDLNEIIQQLNDEIIRVQNLSKKKFKSEFSHKSVKYKQRIQKEIWWEKSDDNVKVYTSTPLKGVVKDLM